MATARASFAPPEDLVYLDDIEVAKMLGISKQQLKVWRTTSPPQGPKVTYFGRLVRYGLADLRAYAASRPTGGEMKS